MKEHLERAWEILCQISVKDADVERMMAVRQELRVMFAQLEQEGKDGG